MDDVQNIEKKYSKFTEPDIKIILLNKTMKTTHPTKKQILTIKDILASLKMKYARGIFDNAQEELTNILKARIAAEEES